jgi:hypothetical protein
MPGGTVKWFTSFPTAIDSPLKQDAGYEFDDRDRTYLDSQILALESAVLVLVDKVAALAGLADPVTWTYASGSTYTFPAGVSASVDFDTTGGPIAFSFPPNPTPGQTCTVTDVGRALATNALTLTPPVLPSGVTTYYPPPTALGAPKAFGAESIGFSCTWRYKGGIYKAWECIG